VTVEELLNDAVEITQRVRRSELNFEDAYVRLLKLIQRYGEEHQKDLLRLKETIQ